MVFSYNFCLKAGVVGMKYEFCQVRGHIEVFADGVFQFSADTLAEAEKEIEEEGQ